jgi:hypothetical protein
MKLSVWVCAGLFLVGLGIPAFTMLTGKSPIVYAQRAVEDIVLLRVLDTAKVKTLELGGDPATNSAGTALTAPATAGAGVIAGSGAAVAEYNTGIAHKTVFTFTNSALALADEAGVVAYVGSKIYDMPAGAILFLGATSDLDLTKSSAGVNADWDGDVGVGTVTASNNATLASTEQNIIPTTATPQAVAGVTTANAQSTATENAVINGTSTAADVYLNLLVDDADHDVTGTPCNLIANGTITIYWINLGDY